MHLEIRLHFFLLIVKFQYQSVPKVHPQPIDSHNGALTLAEVWFFGPRRIFKLFVLQAGVFVATQCTMWIRFLPGVSRWGWGRDVPPMFENFVFLLDGLWIVMKIFRDILQSFQKFYRMSKKFSKKLSKVLKKALKNSWKFRKNSNNS